jgi:hypothetical protein
MFPQEVYQLDQQYYRNRCALSEKRKGSINRQKQDLGLLKDLLTVS